MLEQPIKTCAFTGHRELDKDCSVRKIKKILRSLIKEGAETFYNGMAIGFDLLSAECLLSLKKEFPTIKLIACIPCYGQEKYYSTEDKKRYIKILEKADEKILLSDNYYKGCMLVRDRYMAERADALIAYCKKDEGGTAYTVNYFKKKVPNGQIFFI